MAAPAGRDMQVPWPWPQRGWVGGAACGCGDGLPATSEAARGPCQLCGGADRPRGCRWVCAGGDFLLEMLPGFRDRNLICPGAGVKESNQPHGLHLPLNFETGRNLILLMKIGF